MVHILLIDDDVDLGNMLTDVFAREGIKITHVEDGKAGLAKATSDPFALILLDIMLPEIDGLQVLKQLRQSGVETPVLMLTARGDDVDRVVGLELGADDYLPKPFYPRELIARVKALLRRSKNQDSKPVVEMLRFAGFELDTTNANASCDGEALVLTPTEYEVLRQLVMHHGQLVTKEMLSAQVLGRQLGPFDRSLDVHISNIRKKLPTHPDRIQTVRGRGYRVMEPELLET
ncbi:response regulator transcription factor [Aliidiomarina haloalkalitolerans]|uniref:DNA-binding response regulator n=1 Tax=Aliidiomarina haloalkalitolerans TaxID=859059 RepID=A0A432VRI1_9GAMM|nr:response regulator transcription factor [Aliidiomarina haloalkalitolerans]MCL4409508.1 response regulator transcription factor [Gammaproteobacteria bacterium]RUO18895.1 DNA-binding response regulator [Aliidiomarina haloalkalitolerans]